MVLLMYFRISPAIQWIYKQPTNKILSYHIYEKNKINNSHTRDIKENLHISLVRIKLNLITR